MSPRGGGKEQERWPFRGCLLLEGQAEVTWAQNRSCQGGFPDKTEREKMSKKMHEATDDDIK